MVGLSSAPPKADRATVYDRAHIATYLRLIDAEAAGARWDDAARLIFGAAAASDPVRLRYQYRTHLLRAHWLMATGYLKLVSGRESTS